MYRCFFIGHREAPESIYPELARTVEQLIGQGVADFYVGHYGNFDRLAARAVIAAKQQHSEVRLTMLLPYHPAEREVVLPPGFDGSLYPPGMEKGPRRFAIITGITGTQATLGAALKKLKENGIHIHSAMEKAFSSLYGYTSDENGIRHGGIDFKNAPAEDAKFMLVACSAFINYLIEKWTKVNSRG